MSTASTSSAPPRRKARSAQEYTDVIAEEFRKQWKMLGLGIDRFERTTSDRHARGVQDLFIALQGTRLRL